MEKQVLKKEDRNQLQGIINTILPFSNVDGPGNRMAIFMQGCDIHCTYCHNPETINFCNDCKDCVPVCENEALTIEGEKVIYNSELCGHCDACIDICKNNASPRTLLMTPEDLFTQIYLYQNFIQGVTFSGGEPTLQWQFVNAVFKLMEPLELTRFVDTNGFFDREKIKPLIMNTDKFLFDVKGMENLETLCRTKKHNNIDNLKYLLSLGKVYEVRTVITSDEAAFEHTIETVKAILEDYPEIQYRIIKAH